MQRLEPQSVGDVLRLTIQEANMQTKLAECQAAELWAPLVGEHIAGRCGRPKVTAGIMTVSVPAAPLRQELTMTRSSMIRLINERLGSEVIKDIRFVG